MRWIGLIVAMVVWTLVGCVDGWEPADGQSADGQGTLALNGCVAEPETAPRYAITPDAIDLELCEGRDSDGQVQACATRFACSRQLWRQDIAEDVYACLREQPCRDGDTAMQCLEQAATALAPSEAEEQFVSALADAGERCGDLAEVAPGQADVVYESLTFCLLENDACEAKSGCMVMTLDALVEDSCGYLETEVVRGEG